MKSRDSQPAYASLDMQRTATRAEVWLISVFLPLLIVSVVVSFLWGNTQLGAVPGILYAYPVTMVTVLGLTAYVLYGHSAATGVRGYDALAGGYLFLTLLLAAQALASPVLITDGAWFIGGDQTYSWFAVLWRIAFPATLIVAAAIFMSDRRSRRPPGLVVPVAGSVVVVTLIAALFVGAVLLPDFLPTLASSPLTDPVTDLYQTIGLVQIPLTLTAVVVTGFNLRHRSVVALGLFLVALGLFASAIIRFNVQQAFQFGWYLELGVTFVASVLLLLGLVAQLSRVDRVMTRIATSDDLTGLTSRAAFIADLDDRLEDLRPGEQVGLIWLDLDGFKAVNDQQGHDFGDRLLRIIAQRLNDVVLPTGSVVGRLGGDEFGVSVPGASRDSLWLLSNQLIESMREPIRLQQTNIQLSATSGYAIAPDDGQDARELAQSADTAMYAGKKLGRDRALPYRPHMAEVARKDALRRLQLAEAISQRQLRLFYQSVTDAQTGELWGSEVLVRWQQPDRLASAAEFVPLAEETGQIVELGRVVVDLFVQDMKKLPPQTANRLRWALNLSARELEDTRAVASLIEGLPSMLLQQMVVEVTEAMALQPDSVAEQSLNSLRRAGMSIALDDFGTGYANFSVLERVRPALLKIDRSFIVRAADGDERARAFVAATVAIAHSIGAAVVAEGVEGPKELDFVREIGIELAQGYYLSLPGPLDVLLASSISSVSSAS